MMELVSAKVPQDVIKNIDKVAKKQDRKRSYIIREALIKQFGGK